MPRLGRQRGVQLAPDRACAICRADRRDRPAGAGRGRPAPPAGTGRCRRRRSGAAPPRSARRSRRAPALRTRPRRTSPRCGTKPISRVSGGASVAPVRIGRPVVDLQRVRGDHRRVLPRARSPSASATATAVLPTPVGPKTAIDAHGRGSIVTSPWRSASAPACRPRPIRAPRRSRRRRRRAPSSATHACDLVVLFVSGGAARPSPTRCSPRSTRSSRPTGLIGCGAGGVIGHGREIEGGAAVSVWAANLGEDGTATTFHAAVEELEIGTGALTGHGRPRGRRRRDPARRPGDLPHRRGAALPERVDADAAAARRARVRAQSTATRPCCSSTSDVVHDGAVGARLDGVEMLPMVSQGAAPIGPELTITAGEGHVIGELAGKPALEKLRETIEELPPEDLRADPGRAAGRDRRRLQQARLPAGRLPGARARRRRPGDRAGRDRRRRAPRPGRPAARARRRERGSRPARGAVDPHDRAGRPAARGRAAVRLQRSRAVDVRRAPTTTPRSVADALAGAPAAGFFAAGEIGPVGGGYFLHSFTATVAVFA